jgi:hypothetical protein
VLIRSVYEPLKATVANAGLFKIVAGPDTAFQSEFTWVGIVGVLIKSVYEPLVATAASVGVPVRLEYWPVVATGDNTGLFRICATPDVAFQSELTCAAGIVGVLIRSVYEPLVATIANQ